MTRVLVIDQHAYFRETIVELLANEAGLTVVGGEADAASAVDLVERLRADVVVMDVQMPGPDGASATREILRRRPDVRIVVLTASPHGRLASEALAAGAHACLAKSGRYSALVEAIRAGAPGHALTRGA